MVAAHAILTFGVAEGEGEFFTLAVTSREMLQVERTVKGFSTPEFLQSITIEGLYRVAFVTLKMRGSVDTAVKYDEFIDAWSVMMGDPDGQQRRQRLAIKLAGEGLPASAIMARVAAAEANGYADEEVEGEGPADDTATMDPTQPAA